jgi:hypothetical protein
MSQASSAVHSQHARTQPSEGAHAPGACGGHGTCGGKGECGGSGTCNKHEDGQSHHVDHAQPAAQGGACATSGCCGGMKEMRDDRSPTAAIKQGTVLGDMLRAVNEDATAEQLAQLPILHLVMRYRKGIEKLDQRVFELTEEQIDMAFLPEANVGRWPVRVLLGHLADAEVAAVHRMRRIVGEDGPVVNNWDEDAFVDANLYNNGPKAYAEDAQGDNARVMQALGGSMAVIHTLRQWCGQWLLTLPESAWTRTMMHPARGAVSLKDYVALNTWHLEHHGRFLTQKLDRMGIPHAMPEQTSGGCCGGGCKG